MAGFYRQSKGLPARGQLTKHRSERSFTDEQMKRILEACEATAHTFNRNWKRDYTAIYLGWMFGLRIGEVVLLERNHFRDLERYDTAHLPTIKQRPKMKVQCPTCKRNYSIMVNKAGTEYYCRKCEGKFLVPRAPDDAWKQRVVEKDPPIVEGPVVEYALDYIKNWMRPDQRWLFENRSKEHLSEAHMSRILSTYQGMAGIPPIYSWHAMRHARGIKVWRTMHDLVAVRDCLRHASVSTAEIYAHLDPEDAKAYRKKLEKTTFNPLKRKVTNESTQETP